MGSPALKASVITMPQPHMCPQAVDILPPKSHAGKPRGQPRGSGCRVHLLRGKIPTHKTNFLLSLSGDIHWLPVHLYYCLKVLLADTQQQALKV